MARSFADQLTTAPRGRTRWTCLSAVDDERR